MSTQPRAGLGIRILRGTGTVFIVLGLVLLYFVVYELFGTTLQTRAHQNDLRSEFSAMLDDPRITATPSVTPSAAPPKKSRPRPNAIAQIIIPKIGVDSIVVEGVTLSALGYGPGHYPDSARIGAATGTAAIAGHRTGWGSPFINLDRLQSGDEIILRTPQATYRYRITRGNVVVTPNDYWVVNGDPQSKAKAKLTLTTCTPKYTSRDRLIVWADLMKVEPRAA
jgi:sortase A